MRYISEVSRRQFRFFDPLMPFPLHMHHPSRGLGNHCGSTRDLSSKHCQYCDPNSAFTNNRTSLTPSFNMAAANATGFFDFPAEIRNYIYTLVFTGSTTGIVPSAEIPTDYLVSDEAGWPQQLPGILLASRLCYREAAALFLTLTTLVVDHPAWPADGSTARVRRSLAGSSTLRYKSRSRTDVVMGTIT